MYEENGLRVEDLYMTVADEERLAEHYAAHVDKPFYPPLVKFMMSGELVVLSLCGENAVAVTREINGATDPAHARPGTIRYLFGKDIRQNAVHGSESVEEAERELAFWFD